MNYNVERCPHCGSHRVQSELTHDPMTLDQEYRVRCHACGLVVFGFETEDEAIKYWNDQALKKKDEDEKKDNPYTDFAKEMSLLHEALKTEGFKDSMVDILSKMAPIVWDKVERKKVHERVKASVKDLNKVEYEPPEWIKNLNEENQKREDHNWNRIRKEVMGE